MDRIICRTERDPIHRSILDAVKTVPETTTSDAITTAARQVAETVQAKVIITFTSSGSTTLRAARERPVMRIIAMTHDAHVACRLALVWGVHAVTIPFYDDVDEVVAVATRTAMALGYAEPGDRIVITAGVPFATPGITNLLLVEQIGDSAGHDGAEP